MTDLRKAAEMALEALEKQHNWMVANGGGEMFAIPSKKAINELRQALAQHVDAVNISAERVDETAKREHDRAVELAQAYERGWNAALAQTEQEPVGYINGMHGGYMVFTPINPSAVYLNGTALYIAPPKRQWVGLTDNEARKFYEKYTNREELIYAIDEFLEEKNGG